MPVVLLVATVNDPAVLVRAVPDLRSEGATALAAFYLAGENAHAAVSAFLPLAPRHLRLHHLKLMDSDELQSQNTDAPLIGELRDNVLSAIREVNALKNVILTRSDAEEQAKLEYFTPEEREIWQKFKETKAQKEHWKTFAGSLKKPPATEPEAVRAYEEIADSVAKKIRALDAGLRLLQPTIAGIEDKLNTPDKKRSIQKAVHQMMMNDRRNRDRLKKANEHLDHAVEALRQKEGYIPKSRPVHGRGFISQNKEALRMKTLLRDI